MARLAPRHLEFIAVYCADPHRNGSAAYRSTHNAKASPETAAQGAYRLLQRVDVQSIIRRYDERIAENLILSANDIARIWTENIVTDRNDLVEVRRVCCRCCHSPNGDPEFTVAEQRARRREHELKLRLMLARLPDTAGQRSIDAITAAMDFDSLGGEGYDQRRPINPECRECAGDGSERVIIKDTRKLSPAARAIYEGAKVTKDGIEIKIAPRADAIALLAKAYGLGSDKPPARGGDDARDVTPTDPQEASRYYARLMDHSDD